MLSSDLAGDPVTPLRDAGMILFSAAAKSPLPSMRRVGSRSSLVVDS